MITALIIFIITCLFIGLRQIPRIRIDRPAGALVGAVLMVVFGVLTLDEAFRSVDLRTLLLLLGMMIITAYLMAADFFEFMAERIPSLSRTPLQLIVLMTGLMSLMFLSGDAAAAERTQAGKTVREQVITVTSSDPDRKPLRFRVVLLCDTDSLRAKGLQGFGPLKSDEAALFAYQKPEPAVFWMATVTFPIDIVFVSGQGVVVRVFRDCRPGSRELYPSGEPVKWVIETAAGSGIREGDKVVIGR